MWSVRIDSRWLDIGKRKVVTLIARCKQIQLITFIFTSSTNLLFIILPACSLSSATMKTLNIQLNIHNLWQKPIEIIWMKSKKRELIGVFRELYVAPEQLINFLITLRMSIVPTNVWISVNFTRKIRPHPVTRIFYISEDCPHSDKILDVSVSWSLSVLSEWGKPNCDICLKSSY